MADLHANLEATQAILKKLDEIRPDRIICLGDLAGYNANPNEVIDLIRERDIACLMGNHDAAACGLEEPWFFNSHAQAAISWQAERLREDNRRWLRNLPPAIRLNGKFIGVHGALVSRDDYILDWLDAMRQMDALEESGVRICFFGHSHRASLFSEKGGVEITGQTITCQLHRNNRYFINPGSVGQPRDHDCRAAFGLFDTANLTFEFCRVEYDIEITAGKILACGLPAGLANRLAAGR
ncbi:MAG: metallophosphoesterase family protein [Candidatus Hydrogenedentes bacterium]|nr:metallophosphoesterase family protein [Candidatus Hydrogenedentota bacterium]